MMREMLNLMKRYPAATPADINGAGMDGDWVHFGNYRRCTVVIITQTLGGNTALTLQQATSAAGANAAALGFTAAKRNTDYTAASAEADVAVTGNSLTIATASGNTQIVSVEVRAETLDVAGGFTHFRARLSDPTVASRVTMLYLFGDPAYPGTDRNVET